MYCKDAAQAQCEQSGDSCKGVTCRNDVNCWLNMDGANSYKVNTVYSKTSCGGEATVDDGGNQDTPPLKCAWTLTKESDQVTYNTADAVATCSGRQECSGLRCRGWADCWIFDAGLPDKHPNVWTKSC